MLDSLWLIQFHSPSTGYSHSGVITFQGNQVIGGDSAYYYSGSCSNTDQGATLTVRVRKHSPGASVFGTLNDFKIVLQGKLAENMMLFEGRLEHRELRLQVKLTRLEY